MTQKICLQIMMTVLPWGKIGTGKVTVFTASKFMFLFLFVFLLLCSNSMLELPPLKGWISAKSLLFIGFCPSQHSPPWPRGTGTGSLALAVFEAHTVVFLPITRHTGGQNSSWIPWSMVLDPTSPPEALLLMYGYLICCLKMGTKRRHISHCHEANLTLDLMLWVVESLLMTK